MDITQRGYIINSLNGIVVGTWVVSGGSFIGFPGEDSTLKGILDSIRREGIPVVEGTDEEGGIHTYEINFIRAPQASVLDIGNTLATLGYALLSADEVEDGSEPVYYEASVKPAGDILEAWVERRGYILSEEGRPITLWYMIGDVVEVLPIGNHELDDLVRILKVQGIPTLKRTYTDDDLTGRSRQVLEWADATPMDIATELLSHNFSMLPAMEVESLCKDENWVGDA